MGRREIGAIAAAGLLLFGAGCSDDEPSSERASTDPGASRTTATTSEGGPGAKGSTSTTPTVPKPVPLSKPAKRKGAQDCADTTPKAIVSRYLPAVRKSKGADTAAVRRSLVTQVKRLSKAQGGQVPAPVAAAVYAVSKPRAERSGAYRGCLQSLVKNASK